MRTLLALVVAGVATGDRHLEDDVSLVQLVLTAADDAPNGAGPDGVPLVADGEEPYQGEAARHDLSPRDVSRTNASEKALNADARERTAVREAPTSHLGTVLVVPKLKFLFCYIPKNACTQFNKMLDVMNGKVPGDGWHHQMSSATSVTRGFGWSQGRVKKLLRDKGWTKAVFLRDPLERLVSAWRNKCRHGAEECKVPDACPHCIGGDFEAAVAKLESTEDLHWIKQSRFGGGLPSSIGDYDFVGHTSKNFSDMHAQVVKMLRLALARDSDKSWAAFQAIPGHNCSGHNDQVACISTWLADTYMTPAEDGDWHEEFFAGYRAPHRPGSARTGKDPPSIPGGADGLADEYFPADHNPAVHATGTWDAGDGFTNATVGKALRYYKEDYESLPGLSVPQWALDMQWSFESTPRIGGSPRSSP